MHIDFFIHLFLRVMIRQIHITVLSCSWLIKLQKSQDFVYAVRKTAVSVK